MKKRNFSKLFGGVLAASILLTACGSGGTTTPKDILDSSEPVIGYLVKGEGKDEKPARILVFQEGKIITYEDTEYTMGDFSKMEDEEIIENLNAKQQEDAKEKIESQIESKQSELNRLQGTENSEEVLAESEILQNSDEDIYLWDNLDVVYSSAESSGNTMIERILETGIIDIIISEAYDSIIEEENIPKTFEEAANKALAPESFYGGDLRYMAEQAGITEADILEACKELDTIATPALEEEREKEKAELQEKVDKLQEEIAALEKEREGKAAEEVSNAFICLFSDSTGNEVSKEGIVWDEMAALLNVNSSYLTTGKAIYDSEYYGYNVTDESNNFICYLLFRDAKGKGMTLGFDKLDTKDTYLDLSNNELKEMQDELGKEN